MNLIERAMATVRSYTVFDISMFKLCMFSFSLMLAKLWPELLSLDWYYYGIVFIATYAWLIRKFLTA